MDFREFSFFTNQVALDGEVHDYNSFHNQNEMYETDLMWNVDSVAVLSLQACCHKWTTW